MAPFLPSSAFRMLHPALEMAPFLLNSQFRLPHSTLRIRQDIGSPLLLPLQLTLLLEPVDGAVYLLAFAVQELGHRCGQAGVG